VEWESSRSLFIDLRDEEARAKFADLQNRAFSREDVSLLTLFDPKAQQETVKQLDNAATENGVRNTIGRSQGIDSAVRVSQDKLLLVAGHVEEGSKFVVRDANNSALYTVEFRNLESLARANNVTLILLGCETGMGGRLTLVNSLDVAAQLKRALAAKKYSEFYSALGTAESPFVVTTEQINGSTRLVVRRLDEQERINRAGIGTATTLSVARMAEPSLPARALGLLSIAGGWILLILGFGLVVSVLSFSAKPLKWAFYLVLSPIFLVWFVIKRVRETRHQIS
jgi:hypothetical protein